MIEFLERLDPAVVWQVISDPTRNLTGATLLLAMAILVVLIVLTAVTALLETGIGRRRTAADTAAAVAERRRRPPWRSAGIALLVAVVVLAVLLVGGTVVGTRDRVCVRCHVRSVADAEGDRNGDHPTVACGGCHARRGLSGALGLAAGTVRSYAASLLGPGGDKGHAFSESCLACHEDIVSGTRTVARVRVSHEEFLGEGFRCVDCHAATGHGGANRPNDRPRMSLCVLCHDGRQAPAKCDLCHVGDITGTRDVSMRHYPMVTLGPPTTCRGCHSLDSCNECHGLELPHTKEFVEKGEVHGPQAAFGRRALCERCHTRDECTAPCHPQSAHPADSHVKDWRTKHGADASADTQSWCRGCHNKADFGCRMCHPNYPPPPESRDFR